MGDKLTMSLKLNERRSILVRVSSEHRHVNLDIIPIRGRTGLEDIKKHEWTVPFDGGMVFDRDHNVRRSLNIVGKSLSFFWLTFCFIT